MPSEFAEHRLLDALPVPPAVWVCRRCRQGVMYERSPGVWFCRCGHHGPCPGAGRLYVDAEWVEGPSQAAELIRRPDPPEVADE